VFFIFFIFFFSFFKKIFYIFLFLQPRRAVVSFFCLMGNPLEGGTLIPARRNARATFPPRGKAGSRRTINGKCLFADLRGKPRFPFFIS